MQVLDTPLFTSSTPQHIGVGFHNVGSGVLRASNPAIVKQVEAHYGERCGHLPLAAEFTYVLVDLRTPAIETHMQYLSHLFGKTIKAITPSELLAAQSLSSEQCALVVPYINVPETEQRIHAEMGAQSWGLPSNMVNILKNKADFYRLVDEFDFASFQTPDYVVTTLPNLPNATLHFLATVEDLLHQADLMQYPLGVVLRAAESDGNYGCCLVHEQDSQIKVVPNGLVELATYYTDWTTALAVAQTHLAATMNAEREDRIVISRFVDMADSPGISVVIMDDQVESLGWNRQLQKKGSKACIGTSSYHPQTASLSRWQQEYEQPTAAFFELLLRTATQKYHLDFSSLRGIANLHIILPGPLEQMLQKKRGRPPVLYLAECNPRWTNYTDAILAVIGANRQAQTIRNMRTIIQQGIMTFDKYELPANTAPRALRELIFQSDLKLQTDGTRIICRMATSPMGFIFAGDLEQAQQTVSALLYQLTSR